MNYPMFVSVPSTYGIMNKFANSYHEVSLIAEKNCSKGVSTFDIRCQRTGDYMGYVSTESFNIYNARGEMVFP